MSRRNDSDELGEGFVAGGKGCLGYYTASVVREIPIRQFWVDLNHRPRPYQGNAEWFYKNLQDRGDCRKPRPSYKATQIVGLIVGWSLN